MPRLKTSRNQRPRKQSAQLPGRMWTRSWGVPFRLWALEQHPKARPVPCGDPKQPHGQVQGHGQGPASSFLTLASIPGWPAAHCLIRRGGCRPPRGPHGRRFSPEGPWRPGPDPIHKALATRPSPPASCCLLEPSSHVPSGKAGSSQTPWKPGFCVTHLWQGSITPGRLPKPPMRKPEASSFSPQPRRSRDAGAFCSVPATAR